MKKLKFNIIMMAVLLALVVWGRYCLLDFVESQGGAPVKANVSESVQTMDVSLQ